MRFKRMLWLGALLPVLLQAHTSDTLPTATEVGRGVLNYAFWNVYEAVLYAPEGRWDPAKPYQLSIQYFRSFDGRAIADRSVREMRHQGFYDEVQLAAWNSQMKGVFPNVKSGTVLSAVYQPGEPTMFYQDGEPIGAIAGEDFAKRFFGIWLSEKTSQPALRRALLGLP